MTDMLDTALDALLGGVLTLAGIAVLTIAVAAIQGAAALIGDALRRRRAVARARRRGGYLVESHGPGVELARRPVGLTDREWRDAR